MNPLVAERPARSATHSGLAAAAVLLVLLGGCSDDNPVDTTVPDADANAEAMAVMHYVTTIQDSADRLYARLEPVSGGAASVDSVVRFFLADSGVLSAAAGTQGIWVDYRNGLRGGLLLNPLDTGGAPSPPSKSVRPGTEKAVARRHALISGPRKTLFINPHYSERPYAAMLISTQNECFPRVGYAAPEAVLDEQATVDRFRSLAGAGIVHIYSHGWAWPGTDQVEEVYLMTGETVNLATTVLYYQDLKQKRIIVGKLMEGPDRYFLSPAFVASHNDFRGDSTIIYGGFCFSFRGTWPETMLQSGAAVYAGFDWAVKSNWCTWWARSLFMALTDTSLAEPMNMQKWMNQDPPPKSYFDEEGNVEVHILFQGDPTMTLWTRLQITAVTPGSGLEGADVVISGTGFGATQGGGGVTFNSTPAEVLAWSDREIRTRVPTGATTGDVVVTVNGRASNGYPFVVGASMLTDLSTLRTVRMRMQCVMIVSDGSSEWKLFEAANAPVGVDTSFPAIWGGTSFAANWLYVNRTPTPASDSVRFSGTLSGTLSADGMRIASASMYLEIHTFSGGSLSSTTADALVLTDVPFSMRIEGSYYLYSLEGSEVGGHVSSWSSERHFLQWDPTSERMEWKTEKGVSIEWGSQEGPPTVSVEFSK